MQDARSAADGDFAGYVGARWPTLVRTLVLLGCPTDLAPEVVAAGLDRCRKGWGAAAEYDDLDVVVHRAVLEAWDERLRGSWWSGLRPRSDTDWPTPDLSALDRMTPEVRTGLVLRRFAALDPAQAVAVAGRDAGGPLPPLPDAAMLRADGEGVVVFAPPDDEEMTVPRPAWRRRRGLVTIAGAVVVALLLGGGTWWADRDAADPPANDAFLLDPVKPSRSANPAEVGWYAQDVLHLANATYVLPLLRDLAVLGAGAVYGDRDGRVVYLADDGTRTLLGTKDPEVPFAVSDRQGWVAWVDPAGTNPRLLVYDIGQADIVGELDLPRSRSGPQEEPDTRPVAIDQSTVYFVSADGAGGWQNPGADPAEIEQVEPASLYDVSSTNRLFQLDSERIRLTQSFFNIAYDVPGRGGELSPDGDFAVTRNPEDGSVLVYDTRSGERVDVRPPGDLTVADVTLAPEGAVTYLTIDPDAFPSQEGNDSSPIQGELVTCQLDDGGCESLASFVLDSEAPILAR